MKLLKIQRESVGLGDLILNETDSSWLWIGSSEFPQFIHSWMKNGLFLYDEPEDRTYEVTFANGDKMLQAIQGEISLSSIYSCGEIEDVDAIPTGAHAIQF